MIKPTRNNRELVEQYLVNLNALYNDVINNRVSDEEAKVRLSDLQRDYAKLVESFPSELVDSTPFYTFEPVKAKVKIPRRKKGEHSMDFNCTCKRCVSLHTVGEEDMKLLKAMNIEW